MKDLPKVRTWQLEWDLNLQPSGRKAPIVPLSHHARQPWTTSINHGLPLFICLSVIPSVWIYVSVCLSVLEWKANKTYPYSFQARVAVGCGLGWAKCTRPGRRCHGTTQ